MTDLTTKDGASPPALGSVGGSGQVARSGATAREPAARLDGVEAGITDEEVVAIMAATEALWPKPVVLAPVEDAARSAAWRFSGRWWSLPLPMRRDRPFR
ncbi:MAG: hypothetical protein QM733_05280 [Ilumatobacteraceae bacterium]